MIVKIGNYEVTQVDEQGYDIANPNENLDFYFEINDVGEVDGFIFDSLIPNNGKNDPFLASFSAATLDDAVSLAMSTSRANIRDYAMTWY